VQERKGMVYMTVDEKRHALAQLEEHVTSHGYGAASSTLSEQQLQ